MSNKIKIEISTKKEDVIAVTPPDTIDPIVDSPGKITRVEPAFVYWSDKNPQQCVTFVILGQHYQY